MAGAGEGSAGSGRSPEHAERAGLEGHARRARSGAAETVGELWGELAWDGALGRYEPTRAVARARWQVRAATCELLTLRRTASSSGRALCLALVPLVCCARLWRAFGPAAGNRRAHLLHRLEAELAYAQSEIRAGEVPVRVSRGMVARAGRAVDTAIDDLERESVDRAEALRALEGAAVELASLACRIATTLRTNHDMEPLARSEAPALARQLDALGNQVSTTARACMRTALADAAEERIGIWLSDALRVVSSPPSLDLVAYHDADRSLRAEALCALRASWLSLGARLWLVTCDLDALLSMCTFDSEAGVPASISSRAATMLAASALCERPGEFDHDHAAARQREALNELVMHVCRSLGSREPEAVLCAQQLAVRRLVRVLGALWSIDEHARRPNDQTSRPCR